MGTPNCRRNSYQFGQQTIYEFYGILPAFLLVLFRISGLVLAVPFFSSAALPVRVRVLLAVAIALPLFPMVATHLPTSLKTLNS